MPSTKAVEYHQSITTLPLNKFIQVVVNDNLFAIVISGAYPSSETEMILLKEELAIAWEKIRLEYIDAIGDQEHQFYVNTYKECALLAATYGQIQIAINALTLANERGVYFEQFYVELNKTLRTSLPFSETDFVKNAELLKRANSRSKGIKLQLDLKQSQLDSLTPAQSSKKPTEKYYQSILISLSDHAGFMITDNITTFEFCERLRRLNHYVNSLNKNHGKQ